ncbi:MAG: DUF1073 domain-containing protein [Deltaproteobacteria bacterium]|nr:DUF1073 domain-containing protein [Deltaproteobacteria bacterium]
MGREAAEVDQGIVQDRLGHFQTVGPRGSYEDYEACYSRQDIASTIVDIPAEGSWELEPVITDSVDPGQSAFDKAWVELNSRVGVIQTLVKADKLAGIGCYGVVLLGFSDGAELSQSITLNKNNDLLFLRPVSEGDAIIKKLETDTTDPRYGLPLYYEINLGGSTTKSTNVRVHWSRVIHIAEGALKDEIYGTPRLKKVLNRLLDLERVAGGSSEMFWQGAFPGFGIIADADAEFDSDAKEDIEDELEEYVHGLKRYLKLQGVKLESLTPQVESPKDHVDIQLTLIAAATRIPKRILIGSERGELASSQDERAWARYKDLRRRKFVEPRILRPFIDRCIEAGVLPEPEGGEYRVEWPEIMVLTEEDRAKIGEKKANALAKYASAPGADMVR